METHPAGACGRGATRRLPHHDPARSPLQHCDSLDVPFLGQAPRCWQQQNGFLLEVLFFWKLSQLYGDDSVSWTVASRIIGQTYKCNLGLPSKRF
ncbi:hypothetical protein GN956_G16984 [Arapaima gigas]